MLWQRRISSRLEVETPISNAAVAGDFLTNLLRTPRKYSRSEKEEQGTSN